MGQKASGIERFLAPSLNKLEEELRSIQNTHTDIYLISEKEKMIIFSCYLRNIYSALENSDDLLKNLQVLCQKCNGNKGHVVELTEKNVETMKRVLEAAAKEWGKLQETEKLFLDL